MYLVLAMSDQIVRVTDKQFETRVYYGYTMISRDRKEEPQCSSEVKKTVVS